jgi:hypothetical protein
VPGVQRPSASKLTAEIPPEACNPTVFIDVVLKVPNMALWKLIQLHRWIVCCGTVVPGLWVVNDTGPKDSSRKVFVKMPEVPAGADAPKFENVKVVDVRMSPVGKAVMVAAGMAALAPRLAIVPRGSARVAAVIKIPAVKSTLPANAAVGKDSAKSANSTTCLMVNLLDLPQGPQDGCWARY